MTIVERKTSINTFIQPDAFAALASQMVERVLPSVVQVRSAGRGGGAGVVWRTNGAVVTNDHVIGRSTQIEVALRDGRTFAATVAARNAALDLALLQVDTDDLPAALVGDSSGLRVGELVFAIGHPWGQRDLVTAGIVSGLGEIEMVGTNRKAQYIRSDVRLAPGNSGGPLLNARGEVIGINAMVFGGDLGVAIPAHVAASWAVGLPSRGVTLGVQVQLVPLPSFAQQNGRAQRAAALLVVGVERDSLAERAGVFVGDALLEVNDTAIERPEDLRDVLMQHAAPPLRLQVLRGGGIQTIDVQS
ncbi:MAG TPA: trypsin-like peptidase domain-containing protein [Roseiflexaceae bacterium]|jgi:serine protease Do|nr:trypsin-like peptidase domain-containing protein [Roseiflexaceae bacterium]